MLFLIGALAVVLLVIVGVRWLTKSRQRRRAWVPVARLVSAPSPALRREGVLQLGSLPVREWQPLVAWMIRTEKDDEILNQLALWLSDPATVKTFGFGSYVDELLWARVRTSQPTGRLEGQSASS